MISRIQIPSIMLSLFFCVSSLTGVFAAEKGKWDDSYVVDQGKYFVASHNGKPGCEILLTTKNVRDGRAVEKTKNCLKNIPRISDVVEWRYADDNWTELLNAEGKVKARFFSEDGSEWAEEGDLETALLMLVRDVHPRLHHLVGFESTKGKWRIKSMGGDVLCTVTLTGERDKKNNLRTAFERGCPPELSDLSFWSIGGADTILLFSGAIKNDTLTNFIEFEETKTGFQQVQGKPEGEQWLLERP